MSTVDYELNTRRSDKEFALVYKCKYCGSYNVLYKQTLKAKAGTSYFGLRYSDVYPDMTKIFVGDVEIPKGSEIFSSLCEKASNSCIADHKHIASNFEFEYITFAENIKVRK